MRSLGASRGFVARLVGYETVLLVGGAGIVGVLFGAGAIAVVGALGGVAVSNPFLATLLGTDQYSPSFSWLLMMEHLGLSLVLGAFATLLPIRKVLKVSPLQAMARE